MWLPSPLRQKWWEILAGLNRVKQFLFFISPGFSFFCKKKYMISRLIFPRNCTTFFSVTLFFEFTFSSCCAIANIILCTTLELCCFAKNIFYIKKSKYIILGKIVSVLQSNKYKISWISFLKLWKMWTARLPEGTRSKTRTVGS